METNNLLTRNRKSSLGRSSLIERSIKLLESFFSNDLDQEEFNTLIINNELPGEFRSILWRSLLGILPYTRDKKDWINSTFSYRQSFENYINNKNIQNAVSYYSSRLLGENEGSLNSFTLDFDFEPEFSLIRNELEVYSRDYDIFKSEFLKNSFLLIYIVWRTKNNNKLNQDSINFICKILAILIYSLYPSIIHLNQDVEDIKAEELDNKKIFYFLNSEDYFDHDIYEIFENILKNSELKEYVIKHSEGSLESKLYIEIKQMTSFNEANIEELFKNKLSLKDEKNGHETGLNFIEKISFNFLYFINKSVLQTLQIKGLDIYNLVARYYLSLFFTATKFENISYYIDIVLMNAKTEQLRLLGYIIISSLIILEADYASLSKAELEGFFDSYPLANRDPKDIVGKALKIREKINNKFY